MEITLAIVVVAAVIFFGALISIGNERQRRTIDRLREQVALWAVQDLKIKREYQARTVQVSDPLGWLNKVASKVCGCDLQLQILETFETPPSLVCASGNDNTRIIFSPFSPVELRRIRRGKRNRLSQSAILNPALSLPKGVNVHEMSVLNSGVLFDLELQLAWQGLTGKDLAQQDSLWIYEIT